MEDSLGQQSGANQHLDEDEEMFRRVQGNRTDAATAQAQLDRHIGCPLASLKRVYPVARSKGDIVVWLWLWRLRSVRRSRTVAVSNNGLAELGIDRYAKYRSLRRFAKAGLIAMGSRDGRAVTVTFRA
jgi:hypothetical protein